ncbi:MAG: MFS transporter [Lachnospiraceae bacterium]
MRSLATKTNDPEARLGWPERIGYGINGFGFNAINGIIGSFLTIYMTNVAFLDAGIISTLIAISKVFDGISDLIVGRMVDRTNSRFGKARVWLLRMAIPFAISTVLLFFVPQNWPNLAKYIYVFLMYNVVNTVCLTSIQVPFYAMISLITRNAYERGFLGNVQQIFQTLGNIVVNSLFVLMLTRFSSSAETYFTQQGFTITMIIFGIVMVICAFLTVLFTKERTEQVEEQPADKKEKDKASSLAAAKALFTNKYWVVITIAMFVVFFVIIFYSIGGVYYAQYVFNDMGQISWMNNAISIAQFAVMFATPFVMKKFPKHVVYTFGIALMTLGFLGFGLIAGTGSIPLMILFNVLKGCGLGFAGGMALGLVADAILYGQLKSGIDAVGMGNAGVSAAQKLGLGLGQAVFGWVLSGAGFDGALDAQGLSQPQSVVTAIQFVYNWVPFIMCLVILVLLLVFYRNIEKDLAALKAKQAQQ